MQECKQEQGHEGVSGHNGASGCKGTSGHEGVSGNPLQYITSGCHIDTMLINMHEAPKVSAEGHSCIP